MTGKIFKGVGGFYYVHTEAGEYECRAKGIFRARGEKPLVGDMVEIQEVVDSEKPFSGNVLRIFPRKNAMVRPLVSNVDQAVLVFSLLDPAPSFSLLDRFLVNMQEQQIPAVLLLNKIDLADRLPEGEEAVRRIAAIYKEAGTGFCAVHLQGEEHRETIRNIFSGKTSVICGPSGVGKSSLVNFLRPEASMETGELSRKIRRGKNTTRHTELVFLEEGSYVLDTPGFSSLYMLDVEADRLMYYYPEFEAVRRDCRFHTCLHLEEPDCAVKAAVRAGRIPKERYRTYRQLYEELRAAGW